MDLPDIPLDTVHSDWVSVPRLHDVPTGRRPSGDFLFICTAESQTGPSPLRKQLFPGRTNGDLASLLGVYGHEVPYLLA